MGRTALLFGSIVAACVLTACGKAAEPKVERTVDVSALTFSDVQLRARAAATKPGVIFHHTETRHSDRYGDYISDVWLDSERRVARVEENGKLSRVFSPEKLAELSPTNGRYTEALYGAEGADDALFPFTLDYLTRIIDDRVEDKGIEAAVVDGVAAILVHVQQETNADGDRRTETAMIYLDESFLPLRMELDSGAGEQYRTTHTYRSEYLARDAVAQDFFSFEAVRVVAKTASDNLREAAKPFGTAYWLGEQFEDMVVEGVDAHTLDDGEPELNIGYGMENAGAGGPDAPFPCAHLTQYTTRAWSDRQKLVAENDPVAATRIERDARTVLGGEAHIFEQPADRVLEPARIEGQPAPTPSTLADSSRWSAEITFSDAVVEMTVSCGPPGKNPYRSLEGVRHLLDALQPFDAR